MEDKIRYASCLTCGKDFEFRLKFPKFYTRDGMIDLYHALCPDCEKAYSDGVEYQVLKKLASAAGKNDG